MLDESEFLDAQAPPEELPCPYCGCLEKDYNWECDTLDCRNCNSTVISRVHWSEEDE